MVAGTHGKTTTTSMLAWIFHTAGMQPSFLIGGIAENFGSSFHLGQGKHFILEGDEYDTAFFDKGPKFLHYFPDAMILTSVEFDHADIYKDLDAVETAFKRLVNLIPRRGRIVAFDGMAGGDIAESPSLERCLSKAFCPVERYGASARSDWRITNLKLEPGRTLWSVSHDAATLGGSRVPAGGRIQRVERNRGGGFGGGIWHSERRDCGGTEDVQEREAALGGQSAGEWHHHHRRFRASSHGDCGHSEGLAGALCGRAVVGDSGAAIEHPATSRVAE